MTISWASIIGATMSFALLIGAIMHGTDNYGAFFSLEGVLIVIGGSLAVAFMSFEAHDVVAALRAIGLMFRKAQATHENLHKDLIEIIAWAQIVREKGLRGLEDEFGSKRLKDPFVKYGLSMVVSNYTAEEVRSMMETAADARYERDTIPARVLMSMAGHAPAFGMVGTLVGMVIMLGSFSDDMSGVGKGLSVSLLATLYGVVSARMFYMPAAAKLSQKEEGSRFRNYLIAEGMAMLVANKTPRHIQDRLNSYLRPDRQHDMDALRGSSSAPAPSMTAKTPPKPPVKK